MFDSHSGCCSHNFRFFGKAAGFEISLISDMSFLSSVPSPLLRFPDNRARYKKRKKKKRPFRTILVPDTISNTHMVHHTADMK